MSAPLLPTCGIWGMRNRGCSTLPDILRSKRLKCPGAHGSSLHDVRVVIDLFVSLNCHVSIGTLLALRPRYPVCEPPSRRQSDTGPSVVASSSRAARPVRPRGGRRRRGASGPSVHAATRALSAPMYRERARRGRRRPCRGAPTLSQRRGRRWTRSRTRRSEWAPATTRRVRQTWCRRATRT